LVATRWVFRQYSNQIGLIGNGKKLDLIKRLTENSKYREYIGTDFFTDYIDIPEKGAADKPLELAAKIGEQLKSSKAKVFLVGAGHAKTALLPYLRTYSDAVFIDVGVGIDALAGCVCQERPYFGDWVNFRFKDYNYGEIDQMDYNYPGWDKSKYKTVMLD